MVPSGLWSENLMTRNNLMRPCARTQPAKGPCSSSKLSAEVVAFFFESLKFSVARLLEGSNAPKKENIFKQVK